MTKVELREQIKQEARLKTGDEWDDFIDSLVVEITRDHCDKARYSETLILDEEITLVDAQGAYDLPAAFQNLYELRFGRGPNASYFFALKPFNTSKQRQHIIGYPRNYIIAGLQISLSPYDAILETDTLYISYYADVTIAFKAGGEDTAFPIPRLESTVKKEVIARLQRVHLDFPSADRTGKDAGSSFVSAQSADN